MVVGILRVHEKASGVTEPTRLGETRVRSRHIKPRNASTLLNQCQRETDDDNVSKQINHTEN